MKVGAALPKGWASVISAEHPRLGIGFDIGTTAKQKSNPSAIALTQQVGMIYAVRLLVSWKSKDPAVARALIDQILTGIPAGLRVRRLCVDATSEKYFAVDIRRAFANRVPVELVVASASTEYMGEKMIYKVYLGNLLCNTIEDGYMALPKETWIQRDFRSVVRDRGTFEAEVDDDGRHGDCFDAVKLSLHAMVVPGGPVQASAAGVGNYRTSEAQRRIPRTAAEAHAQEERRNNLML
jgi:hypothetical protein